MASHPPSPRGMTLAEFGYRLWGTGHEEALRRTNEITRNELEQMGLTAELARLWRDFYGLQIKRNRGQPTSGVRAQLLEKCVELLG